MVILLLRGINVGGHHKIKMEALRALCESLGMTEVRTYIQSGNVVGKAGKQAPGALSRQLEDAIEKQEGFRPGVVARTAAELRAVMEQNPFTGRSDVLPNRLAVVFLAADPGDAARAEIRAMDLQPEELVIEGREMYIHFPNGMGNSKLPMPKIERILKTQGTARNWNTVEKLLEMAGGAA
ncbi:MAG: DUF1697 domain-containing protein [Bryobacterales bacterium]|nr:DUF1697 domain-containing protein [Bryobacterales bacterium]